jgi:protein-S-isoprenylcysteine O-methyltransferase Ste14
VWWRKALAIWGILPGTAAIWFAIFWTWFDFWRKSRALTYTVLASMFVGTAILALVWRRWTFAGQLGMPLWIQILGWAVLAAVTVFGTIADRQLGIRVRSFTPFFHEHGRIDLKTTGAYGVVRHPIYAAGIGFGLGIFLVTGYPAVLVASAIFALGAPWFTRREEERLMTLLDDPTDYERYRERVPGLFPAIVPRRSSGR